MVTDRAPRFIIFEVNFSSLGVVAEDVFQGKPDVSRGGETDDLSHSFVGEGGEEKAE